MDCGGPGINRDMRKTLDADNHPHVIIQVLRSNLPAPWQKEPPSSVTSRIRLHIAGQARQEDVRVHITPLGEGLYRLHGSHRLRFSDYGIEPPQAMFGLIRVEDELELSFDVEVRFHPE